MPNVLSLSRSLICHYCFLVAVAILSGTLLGVGPTRHLLPLILILPMNYLTMTILSTLGLTSSCILVHLTWQTRIQLTTWIKSSKLQFLLQFILTHYSLIIWICKFSFWKHSIFFKYQKWILEHSKRFFEYSVKCVDCNIIIIIIINIIILLLQNEMHVLSIQLHILAQLHYLLQTR